MNAGVELISQEQEAHGYFAHGATFNGRVFNNGELAGGKSVCA